MHKIITTIFVLILILLVASGCGTSRTQTSLGADPTGNWTMAAKDAHGGTFQISGVLQTRDTSADVMPTPNLAMLNTLGSAQQANATCLPYRVSLGNGNLDGNAFTGVFTVIAKNGDAVDLHVNAMMASDGMSLSSGTYSLGTPPSVCFTPTQTGAFTGTQMPNASGKWSGTIQPCNWDSQSATCTVTGQPANVTANMNQDNLQASITAVYSVSGSSTFTTGTVNQLSTDLLSGQTWRATWLDNNGARFTMNSQISLSGSLSGILSDASSNYYLLKLSHQS